ncbi:mechanosensitive ion channel family protein [Tychonema sp. BBK16]|uniref:mechanosensitive ion channel family protein n=1 Tax=Tychonema sp. BBK16 TaxID=2699888 RepID=UPI001F3FABF3|nr:mechanosensitive ion channel domain-containing protein [Tychonema sp. BBK16]MCF6372017.1 mechanosensitive ion channel [Tychonema sp. BBK16]
MLPKKVRAIFFIGVVGLCVIWGMPARSQAADEATASPKAETVKEQPKGDSKAAVTTKDPEIPVEELQLLVKPLSLDELANEAAAWQVLLKNKVTEISEAEIAIKRQNRSINKQQEVAGSLDEAKKALEESDKALKTAVPGSAEYKEATKKVEEAKEKLKKAQEGLKEATATKKELKQDSTLNDALKKAEKTGELDQGKQTLDEAKKEREKIPADSPAYTAATEKIDALDKAIKVYEDAEKAQKAVTVPNNTVWGDTIENLTTSDTRKVKFSFRISFDQDVTNIEKVLVDIFKSHPKILEEPAPSTFLFDIEDEYISLIASGWAKTDEFWKVSADILRTIQTRFEQEGVKLRSNAQDIRLISESDEKNSLIDREFAQKQLLQPETAKPAIK